MQFITNHPLISIIVPAYNAADFIEKSVCSAISQTYDNIEIVIVNDGSKDTTESTCQQLVDKDSRIKLFSIPNGGASHARAYGVQQAKGELITFLDADDALAQNALEVMLAAMHEDISIVAISNSNEIISADSFRVKILTQQIISAPWGKLFRKSLFNDFVFDMPRKLVRGEDFVMNMRLAYNDDIKIATITNQVYIYTPQDTSITRTFNYSREHELLFDRELKRSLPNLNKYMIYILKMRLQAYKNQVWCHIFDSEERQALLMECERNKVHLFILDLWLLYTKNKLCARFLVFMDKLYRKVLGL